MEYWDSNSDIQGHNLLSYPWTIPHILVEAERLELSRFTSSVSKTDAATKLRHAPIGGKDGIRTHKTCVERFWVVCVYQFHHIPIGQNDEIWTHNLLIPNQVLYQIKLHPDFWSPALDLN